ncbi:esterase [Photobacterium aquae]|uniref:Esterase n=1 Tax=Photobacterium aquae TaxID=1195763 RepID=A0A0J1H5I7_9GAMM|nr:alpha/beta fold hydrolase [Photobacterium aquae]KLV06995.1 esterase [Photobacterium aquae]
MSSKIYFKQGQGQKYQRKVINWVTRLHHRLAPSHARKVARNLFLTPDRFDRGVVEPEGLVKASIETAEGKLMTYRLGRGPVWLLCHGWSGASSQFFTLMAHIAKLGYTALAFDNIAHGESAGSHAHLPGFIAALNCVLDQEPDITGVVAHSMGSAMVLESRHPQLAGKPILLVAPVLNYTENLLISVEKSGYSMRLFDEVVSEVADEYGYPLADIDPQQQLKRHRAPVVIVHDRGDRFASFSLSEEAAALPHVTLVATEGLGHGRIMQSEPLMQAFDGLAEQITPLPLVG